MIHRIEAKASRVMIFCNPVLDGCRGRMETGGSLNILVLRSSKDTLAFIFLLAIYCWLCRLLLRVVCFLSETSLDKTKFVLANGLFTGDSSDLAMGTLLLLALRSLLVQNHAGPVHTASAFVIFYELFILI